LVLQPFVEREAGMDPITLIATAIAAGAVVGLKDTASSARRDAYAGLKALVRRRIAAQPDAEMVLARYEKAPEVWQAPLKAGLGEAAADRNADLVSAAQAPMNLIDEAGTQTGKYRVDGRCAQGVQITYQATASHIRSRCVRRTVVCSVGRVAVLRGR
jgi:hypothetical protein